MPELAGQEIDDLASAPEGDEPANAGLDIEKIRQEAIAAATAAMEERFKGLQGVIAKKDDELRTLRSQYEQAQLAALGDEEREAELARREQAELDRLRAENELLRLAPEYGTELPIFQRLLSASTAKDQLDLLREVMAPKAPASEQPAGGNAAPPAVDPNNPPSPAPAGGFVVDGVAMTDDLADRILNSARRLRG